MIDHFLRFVASNSGMLTDRAGSGVSLFGSVVNKRQSFRGKKTYPPVNPHSWIWKTRHLHNIVRSQTIGIPLVFMFILVCLKTQGTPTFDG